SRCSPVHRDPCVVSFRFACDAARRDLRSFPTRRSSDLPLTGTTGPAEAGDPLPMAFVLTAIVITLAVTIFMLALARIGRDDHTLDRKSTRLNSSHVKISYAVFCLKKKTILIVTNTVCVD